MTNYKNLELRDGILRDARIIMNNNPNISYEEAFNMAKKELIGDYDILSLDVKNFDINIDDNLLKNNTDNVLKDDNENIPNNTLSEVDKELYNPIMDKIDITKYDKAQLKQYLIGDNMGVDITLFANPNFSPKQIKFLCVMMTAGKDVDQLFTNYDFDPNEVFANIDKANNKQYVKINTNN